MYVLINKAKLTDIITNNQIETVLLWHTTSEFETISLDFFKIQPRLNCWEQFTFI